jgi:hypothetical protein
MADEIYQNKEALFWESMILAFRPAFAIDRCGSVSQDNSLLSLGVVLPGGKLTGLLVYPKGKRVIQAKRARDRCCSVTDDKAGG